MSILDAIGYRALIFTYLHLSVFVSLSLSPSTFRGKSTMLNQ